eukprot:gene11619-15558_t
MEQIEANERTDVSRVMKQCGSYRFRIEGYSGLSTRVGESVESPEFILCGHQWQLRIFPGGSLEAHKGYVSYYLASKSTKVARASYRLFVLNQISGGSDEMFASSGIRTFEPKGVQVDGWGRDKFMLQAMLNSSDYGFCANDAVTFKVEITVFGELNSTVMNLSDTSSKCKTLSSCLLSIYDKQESSDISITVGEEQEKIYVHQSILIARSPVFAAMLSNKMVESISKDIIIPEIEPNIIREMLHFMYTDSCTDEKILEAKGDLLLDAAKQYQVEGLITICETYYSKKISNDTVINLLKMADTYSAVQLKEQCLAYIANNAAAVMSQIKELEGIDESLLGEVTAAIEIVRKRKGCRDIIEKERRFVSMCIIV